MIAHHRAWVCSRDCCSNSVAMFFWVKFTSQDQMHAGTSKDSCLAQLYTPQPHFFSAQPDPQINARAIY